MSRDAAKLRSNRLMGMVLGATLRDESSAKEAVEEYVDGVTEEGRRRVVKTHAPYELRPWMSENGSKIIVVTRK